MKIVAFSGGVGGAKLADGLAQCLPPSNLTVIVNTGDDFDHLGLRICPDLDTVVYTLAGLANPATGWGRAEETWNALETLQTLGSETWFKLGDRDLGLHLERTRRLAAGETLSQVTQHICRCWGIEHRILPVSDQRIATIVDTVEYGELPFQQYFVKHQCHPAVKGFRFEGIETAQAAPGVLSAIHRADAVVLTPSNPWVSLDPILCVPGIRQALEKKRILAVSPIIAGKTVKGPAAKMFDELGIAPSALAVAQHYHDLIETLVIDRQDESQSQSIAALGITPLVTDTIMKTRADRKRLAQEILNYLQTLTA
ncbi:MAG: 2-phospho-L-lactate transferase [Anaerolineae bacterium]|nr:2-phospho-L-lactate transferase [Anaerolineae bacterium]